MLAAQPSRSPAGRLILLEGPNFSGRTERLRQFAGLTSTVDPDAQNIGADTGKGAYVAPDSHNYLSGLATTGTMELDLHGLRESPVREAVLRLIAQFGLADELARNPFTLSGGEQVILTILSAICLAPDQLALDCVFEQLAAEVRDRIFDFLRSENAWRGRIWVCDNRMAEYSVGQVIESAVMEERANNTRIPPKITSGCDLSYPIAPAVLELDGLTFGYHKTQTVLNNVSFRFEPGNIYLLTGVNGAGKSTLSRLLCGILRPRRGVIRAGGREVMPWRRPAELVAYHFQNPDLQLFNTTVSAELSPLAGDETLAGSVAHAFGLNGLLERHPLDLPYVLRKRVAMAAAIGMMRPWLILDEPTLGQDNENCLALIALLKGLAAAGAGVIVISHSTWFQAQLPAEHLLLEGGGLRSIG